MVSDNDCDVAVCNIKGRGDFSPPSDFVCTLYIQNLCLHILIDGSLKLIDVSFKFYSIQQRKIILPSFFSISKR